VASFSIALLARVGEQARPALARSRQDRALGAACLIACPAISGLFLGLVAILYAYPAGSSHALALGSAVGGIAFVANALAICLTASHSARLTSRRTARQSRTLGVDGQWRG
jgi:hypothetical protein